MTAEVQATPVDWCPSWCNIVGGVEHLERHQSDETGMMSGRSAISDAWWVCVTGAAREPGPYTVDIWLADDRETVRLSPNDARGLARHLIHNADIADGLAELPRR